MGNPNNKAIIGVGYKVDKASASEVLATNKSIDTSFQRTADDIRKAFRGSDAGVSALNKRLGVTYDELRAAVGESDDLRDSLEGAAKASQKIKAPKIETQKDVTSVQRADAVDSTFGRASAIASGLGQGDLANTAGLIADVAAGFKELPNVIENAGVSLSAFTSLSADIGAAASRAIPGLSGTAAGIVGVGAVALPFIAVAAAMAAAIAIVTSHFEEGRGAITGYIEGEQTDLQRRIQLAQEERTLSSEQLQARIEDNEIASRLAAEDLVIRQQQLASIQAQIAARGDTGGADFELEALRQSADLLSTDVANLTTQVGNYDTAIQNDTNVLLPAITAREAATRAEEDFTAATEALTAATQIANSAITAGITERVNNEVGYYRLATSASSESIRAQIEANDVRVAALNQELQSLALMAQHGQDVTEAVSNVNREITELEQDTQRLSGTILNAAKTREEETNAVKRAEEAERNRARTLEQVASIQAQISADAASQAQQDLRSTRDLQRQRLYENIDFLREQAKAEADFHQQQLDAIKELQALETEAKSATLEAEKEYAEQEIKRTENFEKKLADIRRKAQLEIGEAAGELDAKRVLAAIQARDEELKGAVDANSEEAIANRKARDERIAAANEQLNEQRQQLQARLAQERQAFQEQQAAAVAAFAERRRREDEARAIQRNDEIADRTARRQAQVQQLLELQSALAQEKATRRQALQEALADTSSFFNQIASFARNASNSAANAQASSASNNRGRISSSASSAANKPASSNAPSSASRPNSAARPSASSGRIGASNPMRRLAAGGIARAGMEGFGYFEPNRNYNEAIIPLKADTLRSMGLGNSATVQQTNNFYGVEGAADATAQLEAVTRKVIYKVFQGMP